MFHAKILCQNLRHSSFWNPQISFQFSHSRWSWLTADCTPSTFSGDLLVAGLSEHGSLSTDSWPSLKCLCHTFPCTALTALSPKAFRIISIISRGMFKLNTKFHCSTGSFWMWRPQSAHAHSMVSTAPTDWYSEFIIAHTCAFQPTLLGCQVTLMSWKLFSLY